MDRRRIVQKFCHAKKRDMLSIAHKWFKSLRAPGTNHRKKMAEATKNPAEPEKDAEETEWPEDAEETEWPEEQEAEEMRVFLRALEDPVLSVLLYVIDNDSDPTRKPPGYRRSKQNSMFQSLSSGGKEAARNHLYPQTKTGDH